MLLGWFGRSAGWRCGEFLTLVGLEFALEGFIENGGEHGIKLGGRLGSGYLKFFKFFLNVFKMGYFLALLFERWNYYAYGF